MINISCRPASVGRRRQRAIYPHLCESWSKNFISRGSNKSSSTYRFRFIGCEALCMRVGDSRDTDLRSANEDVHILTPLNFLLPLRFSPHVRVFFFLFTAVAPLFCTISPITPCDFTLSIFQRFQNAFI